MNTTMFFTLLMLFNILSTQTFFTADQPSCLDRTTKFFKDLEQKQTCVGTCLGEQRPQILKEMSQAEKRICSSLCDCCFSVAVFCPVCYDVFRSTMPIPALCLYGGLFPVSICCYSTNNCIDSSTALARLAHQSYKDREARVNTEIDEFLSSENYRRSPFQVIDASAYRRTMPIQQTMEMNPTPIRRHSPIQRTMEMDPTDLSEDPTHLQ